MDRRTMVRYFDEWMTTGHGYFRDTGRYAKGRNLVKSYLVEANAPEVGKAADGVHSFFTRAAVPTPLKIVPTDDPVIYRLAIGARRVEFFLDTLDTRFWMLHTVSSATLADNAIRSLVHRSTFLDAFWFPTRQLEAWTGDLGVPRSMTAKFALRTGMYQESLPEDDFLDNSFYLRIGSHGDARQSWHPFQGSDVLAPRLALWAVKLSMSVGEAEVTTVSDVTANGKVTSRGNSFRLHQQALHLLTQRYSSMIEGWENQFRLGWTKDDRALRPFGSTAVFLFPEVLEEDHYISLLTRLFSCAEPFRIFGIPARQSSGRTSVKGVDLHTGGKIDFEVTPSFIRAYLYPSTCGNVLARLLTNLQHFVDARIELQ